MKKLPERRFQSAEDLGFALRMAVGAHPRAEAQRRRTRRPIGAVAVAGLLLAAAAAAWFWFGRSRATTPEAPLTALPLTSYPGLVLQPAFSPDGNEVAFCWKG